MVGCQQTGSGSGSGSMKLLAQINAGQLPNERTSERATKSYPKSGTNWLFAISGICPPCICSLSLYRIYIWSRGSSSARSYRSNCFHVPRFIFNVILVSPLCRFMLAPAVCSSVGNPSGGRIFVSLLCSVINTSRPVLDLINLIRIYERVGFNFNFGLHFARAP